MNKGPGNNAVGILALMECDGNLVAKGLDLVDLGQS